MTLCQIPHLNSLKITGIQHVLKTRALPKFQTTFLLPSHHQQFGSEEEAPTVDTLSICKLNLADDQA